MLAQDSAAFFEVGEKTGRLLAKIAQSQHACPAIGAIWNKSGRIVNSPELIVKDFYGLLRFSLSATEVEVLRGPFSL